MCLFLIEFYSQQKKEEFNFCLNGCLRFERSVHLCG